MSIAPADRHKPWAKRAAQLQLACHCFDCLRANGISPDHAAHIQHRKTTPDPAQLPDLLHALNPAA